MSQGIDIPEALKWVVADLEDAQTPDRVNAKIRGWANHHRHVVSGKTS